MWTKLYHELSSFPLRTLIAFLLLFLHYLPTYSANYWMVLLAFLLTVKLFTYIFLHALNWQCLNGLVPFVSTLWNAWFESLRPFSCSLRSFSCHLDPFHVHTIISVLICENIAWPVTYCTCVATLKIAGWHFYGIRYPWWWQISAKECRYLRMLNSYVSLL